MNRNVYGSARTVGAAAGDHRIGELMEKVPKKQGFASAIRDTGVANVETKTEVIEAAGFTPKQVERFQQLVAIRIICADGAARKQLPLMMDPQPAAPGSCGR